MIKILNWDLLFKNWLFNFLSTKLQDFRSKGFNSEAKCPSLIRKNEPCLHHRRCWRQDFNDIHVVLFKNLNFLIKSFNTTKCQNSYRINVYHWNGLSKMRSSEEWRPQLKQKCENFQLKQIESSKAQEFVVRTNNKF